MSTPELVHNPTSNDDGKPIAVVSGQPYLLLPQDLYIPPDALEVFLDAFEGPLDLLLYLIKKQNLDILDIPIAEITRQYIEYVEIMKDLKLELAAEYLVMAAMLAEIKSRMLLPKPVGTQEDEADPRAELVRRLQEYERYKQAAEDIDGLPRLGRDVSTVLIEITDRQVRKKLPECRLDDLLSAFRDVLKRAQMFTHHQVQMEPLSVRERMSELLAKLHHEQFTEFTQLFSRDEGRMGVVVSFLAILELVKETLIELVQNEPFGPIYLRTLIS